jgi:hypothetical protein
MEVLMLMTMLLGCTSGEDPSPPSTQAEIIGLLVTPEQIILPVGQEIQLQATGLTGDHEAINLTESVEWMVEYYNIIEVSESLDSEGVLTAQSAGLSRIYAQYNELRSPYVEAIVTEAELEELSVSPSQLVITEGDQMQLEAYGSFSDGESGTLTQQVRWVTENAAIAQFAENGIVEGVSVGTTSISAIYDDTVSSEVNIEVKPYVENGKPDLIVEDLLSQQDDGSVIISTTIVNQGSNGATGFWLDLFIGSTEPDFNDIGDVFVWIDYLGPNRGIILENEFTIQGTTTIWALVDTTLLITESHENNNKKSTTINLD